MSEPGFLFDRNAVMRGLRRLDAVLVERNAPSYELIVVGGSYLALADLRGATRDIDTVTRLESELRSAIEQVATQLDYPPSWLNDNAAAFRPRGLDPADCTVEFSGERLTALMPPADWIFLMKLYAGRTIDRPDLIRLWPETTFSSPADAVRQFWVAYPDAPPDEFLEGYVSDIAGRAG